MSQTEHLKKLLGIHERNLRLLKLKEANYGLDVPVSILNQIASEEEKIKELKAKLGISDGTTEETSSSASASSASSQSSVQEGGVTFNVQGNVHLGEGAVIAGRDAQNVNTQVTKTENPDLASIADLFKTLYLDIDKSTAPLKEQAKNLTQKLEEEVTKSDGKPDEVKIEGLLKGIKAMAPDIFEVSLTTFAKPVAGIAMVINKIGEKIKAEAR